MQKRKRKRFLKIALSGTLFLALFLFFFPFPVLGEEEPEPAGLEVVYPDVGEEDPPADVAYGISQYTRYVFLFALGVLGILLFVALVYNGIKYMLSAGDPGKRKEAITGILAAFGGAIFLLLSYIILNTIDPDLTDITMNEPEEINYPPLPAGPYVCNFEISDIGTFLSEYDNPDTRNEALEDYYKTLKEEGGICAYVDQSANDLQDSSLGALNPDDMTYFTVPEVTDDGGTEIKHGIMFYSSRKGRARATTTAGSSCHYVLGQPDDHHSPLDDAMAGFGGGIKSVSPIRLNTDEGDAQEVQFFEGYDMNSEEHEYYESYPDDEKPMGSEEVSISSGSTTFEQGDSELDEEFHCEEYGTGWLDSGVKYPICGIRSIRMDSDIFVTFETSGSSCRIALEDINDTPSDILPSVDMGDDHPHNFKTSPYFDRFHIIKGRLGD